jgi:hypothetical protein
MNDSIRTEIMKISIIMMEEGSTVPEVMKFLSLLFPKQRKDSVGFVLRSSVRMYRSLCKAVNDAGGSGWPVNEVLEMNIMDLISKLATNGVRFTYVKEKDK